MDEEKLSKTIAIVKRWWIHRRCCNGLRCVCKAHVSMYRVLIKQGLSDLGDLKIGVNKRNSVFPFQNLAGDSRERTNSR